MSKFQWISTGIIFLIVFILGSRNTHCGESNSSPRQVNIQVQINAEMPVYAFFLTPDPVYISSEYLNSRQTVKIEGEWPTDPAFNFILHDIDFDGYLDFATSERGGAKWGICHYLVFDKVSGQFVSNWLTRRLEKLKHNGIHLDVKSKEIRVDHLVLSEGLVSESYKIQGSRLVLVETVEMHYDEEELSSIITTKRLVNGEMRIIKTEPQ